MADHQALIRQMQMSMDPNAGSDILTGLRTQILANACHVFPLVIKEHTAYNSTGVFLPPNKIFDIIISRPPSTKDDTPSYQAILTYGHPFARKTAVMAEPSSSIEGSLVNLVAATGRIIAQTMGTITEELKEVSLETYGARYDWELISKSREISAKKRGK